MTLQLADLVLSLCQLLRHANWSDPGDAYELGRIAAEVERLVTEELGAEDERELA